MTTLSIFQVDSLVENADFMSIDDELVTLNLDFALEAAVGGVILEHVDLKEEKWRCQFWLNVMDDKHRRDVNLKCIYI